MAAKTPENEHVQKLLELTKRYDIDELLDAAATFQDWLVITNEEKRVIKHQSNKLDRLMTLITESGRVARFANFILRYNSDIQVTALAVVNTVGATTHMRPKAESSASQVLCADYRNPPEQVLQQPYGSLKSTASSTGSPDPMDVDSTDSQEASSMETGSKVWAIHFTSFIDSVPDKATLEDHPPPPPPPILATVRHIDIHAHNN